MVVGGIIQAHMDGAMSELDIAVVIENDADMRNMLEGVMLQSGFEVHTAADGREGVEVVRDKKPAVVTLDVGLPDVDGFEILRRIRRFSNAYIVIVTDRSDETDLLTALRSGADGFITKPFRPREMRARIAAMMRRPRPGPPPAR
ncbi:DNA-binding response OmpR family regulator [Arthrobacter sp. GAS37]